MTPERFNALMEHCFRRHRREADPARYEDLAQIHGREPDPLRAAWRSWRAADPAFWCEIVMEVFHEWPEVRADRLEEVIQRRNEVITMKSKRG